MQNKKSVALIYGGRGAESEVSRSGAEYVKGLIDKDKYTVISLYISKDGSFHLTENGSSMPASLIRRGRHAGVVTQGNFKKIDVAFPLLHGDYGEDGRIQGFLDTLSIKYVGCGVSAGSLATDKIHTKIIASSLKIPTLEAVWHRALNKTSSDMYSFKEEAEKKIGYPMFIKPISLGSSVGACAILKESDFEEAYLASLFTSSDLMIEPYLAGKRELECAYLRLDENEYFSTPGEIECGGVYSYEEKYSRQSSAKTVTDADLPAKIKAKLKSYSHLIVKELGIRQLSRIDYFLDGGKIYFNEINTMPGFTEASLYPRLIDKMGISPVSLINSLIEDTLNDRRV